MSSEKVFIDEGGSRGPIALADDYEEDLTCTSIVSIVSSLVGGMAAQLKRLVMENPEETFIDSDGDFDSDDVSDIEHYPDTKFVESRLSSDEKLKRLRLLMKEHNIGVYIIPSEDEHQSEYTALADKRREFLTGFTGSAGVAVVSLDNETNLTGKAALSTDGRYFLQAEKQLDPKLWRLLKAGAAGYPSWTQFAIDTAINNPFSKVISVDPRLISISIGEYFANNRVNYGNKYDFKPISEVNLVDRVWGAEKPHRSLEPVFPFPIEYSGESSNDKLKRVRDELEKLGSTHLVVSDLDEVAWLFNLRSTTDIPFNTSFFSYAIVTANSATLYINEVKIDDDSRAHLDDIDGLVIKSYNDFYQDLSFLKATVDKPKLSIVLPSRSSATYALLDSIPASTAKAEIKYQSVVGLLKTYKNVTELKNARIAQQKDSLAIIIAISWLEHQLVFKKRKISEWDFAKKLFKVRSNFPNFKGLSFESIAASGPNSSSPHYFPTKENHSDIDPKNVFLADVGSQFLEGTTDITRSFLFDESGLKPELKKHYTLVLKGHIGVANAKFPQNSPSTGAVLDAIARQPLWNEGLDFNHGVGHGVGSFGNVHEGPLGILSTTGGSLSDNLFKKGGILSDEPGYYDDGHYGFRIESELEIIELDSKFGKTRAGQNFLGFAYLTQVPFSNNLIDTKYLSYHEIRWINEYHRGIRLLFAEKLLDIGEKGAYKWLLRQTRPIF